MNATLGRLARYDVLLEGTVGHSVASTCSLVREGDVTVVIDPGLAPGQAAILDPLRRHGLEPADVTDVVLSHHHPDHTLNAGLFAAARVHDHWAIYDFAGRWDTVEAEGRVLSPSIVLVDTPGHSAQDISVLVGTGEGLVAFTHAWWSADGPADDPYAPDAAVLHASRARLLQLADVIVPAHGAPFRPDASTAR